MAATTIRTAAQQLIEAEHGRPIAWVLSDLYATGLSQEQVAERLGVSRASVLRWMKRLDVAARPRGGRRAA